MVLLFTDATAELGDDFEVSAPDKLLHRISIFGFTEEYNAENVLSNLALEKVFIRWDSFWVHDDLFSDGVINVGVSKK